MQLLGVSQVNLFTLWVSFFYLVWLGFSSFDFFLDQQKFGLLSTQPKTYSSHQVGQILSRFLTQPNPSSYFMPYLSTPLSSSRAIIMTASTTSLLLDHLTIFEELLECPMIDKMHALVTASKILFPFGILGNGIPFSYRHLTPLITDRSPWLFNRVTHLVPGYTYMTRFVNARRNGGIRYL